MSNAKQRRLAPARQGGEGSWRSRSHALAWLLLLISAACRPGPSRSASEGEVRLDLPQLPGVNVLVISFDALRADALGVYGNTRGITPNLDRWALEALVFDRAQTAGHATPFSFAAAFTGKLPFRVFRGWRLEDGPTLASLFAAAGYATAFFSNNAQVVANRNFQQGFDRYDLLMSQDLPDNDHDGVIDDEAVLQRAQDWIENNYKQQFFAWVHFLSPHSPYTYRDESKHLYDEAYRGPFETTTGHTFEVESDADLVRLRHLYDGEVFYADRLFAALEETVERLQLKESTVIVVTADHGEEFLDHGGLQHGTLYEEVIRIPLMIYHPGKELGTRTEIAYSNVDLMPTLAHIAALELETGMDGISLAGSHDPRRLLVTSKMGLSATASGMAVTRGSSKLIASCSQGSTGQLYDLKKDPEEQHNLAAETPGLYRELHRELIRMIGDHPCSVLQRAVAGAPPTAGLEEGEIETLAALGYLDVSSESTWSAPAPHFSATPNPIPDCDGTGLGVATLRWDAPTASPPLEVRVNSPNGAVMSRAGQIGEAATEKWVRDGMTFFLVESPSSEIVATTTVNLVPCDR